MRHIYFYLTEARMRDPNSSSKYFYETKKKANDTVTQKFSLHTSTRSIYFGHAHLTLIQWKV